MKSRNLILAATLLGSAAAQAATISWTSASFLTTGPANSLMVTGQFNNTGTFVSAQNVGGSAYTFDGINFAAGTISGMGGVGAGTFNGFHDSASPLTATGAYGTDGVQGTVSLTGLTLTQSYRIQALIFDGRDNWGISGSTVAFDGTNLGQYAFGQYNVTWGNGMLVTGTFTADAATQNFTIETFKSAANGSVSRGGQINALTLFAVPEPSAILLGSLGMLGLLRRRR